MNNLVKRIFITWNYTAYILVHKLVLDYLTSSKACNIFVHEAIEIKNNQFIKISYFTITFNS